MRRIVGLLIVLVSAILGLTFIHNVYTNYKSLISWLPLEGLASKITFYVLGTIIFGIIFYFILLLLREYIEKLIFSVTEIIEERPRIQIIGATIGFLAGGLAATLISNLYKFIGIPIVSMGLSIATYIFFSAIGALLGGRISKDPSALFDVKKRGGIFNSKSSNLPTVKVLDTSSIIDGRIVNIAYTGFLEGEILVPEFVLKELRHLADSADDLTRAKGRRGLDYIKEIQKIKHVKVKITDEDFEKIDEVDLKLLKLAKKHGGSVITNDYNLNKVAKLQKILVLNVNDLSNAVKSNAIPGETMNIEIMRKGKEAKQGIGYLEDGTMVVVENANNLIGQTLPIEIKTVLQTPAGRMMFGRVKR